MFQNRRPQLASPWKPRCVDANATHATASNVNYTPSIITQDHVPTQEYVVPRSMPTAGPETTG